MTRIALYRLILIAEILKAAKDGISIIQVNSDKQKY